MTDIIITRNAAADNSKCPCCQSTEIENRSTGCMCRIPDHSCWSYPTCSNCGYTAGGGAGNSDGGIWVSFSTLCDDETYTINSPLDIPSKNSVSISQEDFEVIIESLDESIFQLGLRVKDIHPAQVKTIKTMNSIIKRFENTKTNITLKDIEQN